jgi:hypothetical protein
MIFESLKIKYICLNGGCRRDDPRKIVPAFFYFDMDQVLSGVWSARFRAEAGGAIGNSVALEPLLGGYEDRFLVGPLQWLTVNPGRQMIGQIHTRTHTITHAQTQTLTHTHMHTLTYMHTHTYTYTHTHTHIHTHTRTHTHTHRLLSPS